MRDTFKELERACERATKELCEFMDRIDQNKNVISPADLNSLSQLVETIKNSKSAMKKIIELDEMMDEGSEDHDKRYSGYYTQPIWDRRSGNSYHGQYTIATGDGYSSRRMSRGYSRNSERESMRQELEGMLQDTRDEREADIIRKLITRL